MIAVQPPAQPKSAKFSIQSLLNNPQESTQRQSNSPQPQRCTPTPTQSETNRKRKNHNADLSNDDTADSSHGRSKTPPKKSPRPLTSPFDVERYLRVAQAQFDKRQLGVPASTSCSVIDTEKPGITVPGMTPASGNPLAALLKVQMELGLLKQLDQQRLQQQATQSLFNGHMSMFPSDQTTVDQLLPPSGPVGTFPDITSESGLQALLQQSLQANGPFLSCGLPTAGHQLPTRHIPSSLPSIAHPQPPQPMPSARPDDAFLKASALERFLGVPGNMLATTSNLAGMSDMNFRPQMAAAPPPMGPVNPMGLMIGPMGAAAAAAAGGLFPYHFRKPKRIRTAFSPSQLLELEKAFENNHYVVGQERKDLAAQLKLSETQVKVWFQNRRTKYKRVKPDSSNPDDDPRSDDDELHSPTSVDDCETGAELADHEAK